MIFAASPDFSGKVFDRYFATGVSVGFQQSSYTVSESSTLVTICVEIVEGEAAFPVEVALTTASQAPAQGNTLL